MGIYQRGESWWIDYRYRNKRYREAVGADKALAIDVLAQRHVEIRENRFFPEKLKVPAPITFHSFCKEYRQYSETNKKPSTCSRELAVMRMLDSEFKGKHISDITTWEVETWKLKRKKRGLAVATVNRELCLLKHMFTMAVKWKRIRENPARQVPRLKGAAKRTRFLMPDEVELLLSNCNDWLRPVLTLAVHTGMRRGELLSLMWPQVNLEQGIITLLDTKNGERRDIPMDDTVRRILEGTRVKGDFIFSNRSGRPIEGASLYRAFYEALQKSKIENFKWHDIRHTFASNLVMAGVDLNTVRELLGHKDLKMTLRYAHLAPGYRAKAINILDGVFSRSQKRPQEEKVVNLRP